MLIRTNLGLSPERLALFMVMKDNDKLAFVLIMRADLDSSLERLALVQLDLKGLVLKSQRNG